MITEANHGESEEQKIAELDSILSNALSGKSKQERLEFYNLKLRFQQELKSNHPDIRKYKLYHLLIRSGEYRKDDETPEFDLPNGEIESYIRNLPNLENNGQ